MEEDGRLQVLEVMDDSRETVLSRENRADIHMNSERLCQDAEDLYKITPDKNPRTERRM